MVKFALPKNRLQILKDKPELVPLLEKIYKKYGLDPSTKPIGSGGSNDVFDIGKGKILRLEISKSGKTFSEQKAIEIIAKKLAKFPKYTPKLYEYKLYNNGRAGHNQWHRWDPTIHTYVYGKVNIVPWVRWREVYQSERDLVNGLFGMINYFNRHNILHSDPSPNNIVLTANGPMFIDTDVMCIVDEHDDDMMTRKTLSNLCDYADTMTGPYPAPEMFVGISNGMSLPSPKMRRMFKTYEDWAKREYGIRKLEYDARGLKPNSNRDIEENALIWKANSIHAAGMIAHYAIMGKRTRSSPLQPISFDGIPASVRGKLRAAMHPNPSQRTLGSTRALSSRKSSGSKAPSRKSSGRKSSGRKAPARKSSGRKSSGRKPSARKAPARKSSSHKAPARKSSGRKVSDGTLLKRHQALQKKNATVASLRKRCKQNGVKGYSKQRKSWLLKHCGDPHKSARRSSSVRRSLRSSKRKVSSKTQPRVSKSKMTVKELRARCKEKGVKRYSKQRKAWLVKNC